MTRLSNRQFPMLQMFASESGDFHMSVKGTQQFDQRPFRSMLIRGWIAYRPGHGFHITRDGRAAWSEFQETDITRKDPSLPLTAYFDPTAYGLKIVKRATGAHKRAA